LGDWLSACQWVTPSIPNDESRPSLCGANVRRYDDGYKIVAADGYKLSIAELAGVSEDSMDVDVTIPTESVAATRTLFSGAKDDELLSFYMLGTGGDSTHILTVSCENGSIMQTSIIGLEYPDLVRMLKNTGSLKLKIPRAEFMSALNIASMFSPEDTVPHVRIDIKSDSVNVYGESGEHGDADNSVDIESSEECDFSINASPTYLAGILSGTDNDHVHMMLENDKPSNIFVVPVKDTDYMAMIAPMRG
jgi:DNA polymerase III sliding clamp (beta) subunit (PCNA family)